MAALPPPMTEIMRNKGANYECYQKGEIFGYVVKEYMKDGVHMAVFVYRDPVSGILRSDRVKMAKLERRGRESCAEIPTNRISMFADGGRRRTNRRRRRVKGTRRR